MAIDRDLWTPSFKKEELPAWPCPQCKRGTLRLQVEKNRPRMLEGWLPENKLDWQTDGGQVGVFTCLLQCNSCNNPPVVLSGNISHYVEFDETNKPSWELCYDPLFFNPPLNIFPIPPRCPAEVKKELLAAFRLYWCDPASCVNHQRIAIESLLTKMNVPRFSKNRKHRLFLHHRIERLPEKTEAQREIKEALLAIKFIGNEGSHAGYIAWNDALDGFEQLELAVDEESREQQRAMRKRRTQIIKQKAPRGKADARREQRRQKKLLSDPRIARLQILSDNQEP